MANVSLTGLLRSTVATIVTLLAGVALVALSALLVASEAPDGTRDLDAYKAAPRCPAAPTAPAECRWTQELTVSDIRRTHKKGELDRAFLTDADGDKWETAYTDNGPVLDDLGKGDRGTGTIWRGRLTEVAMGGDSQDTEAAPDDVRARVLIGALIMAPPGLLMAAACVWRLSRRAAPEPTPGMIATLGLALGLFCAGLFTPLLAGAGGENFWIVAAVWFPLAAIMTAAARIYATRKGAQC